MTPRPGAQEHSPVDAELDRVGASFRKAGAAGFISVQLGLDEGNRSARHADTRAVPGLALRGGCLSWSAVCRRCGVDAVWRALGS